jgi:hypothetical protein
MDHAYRLENVDPKLEEDLKKAKETQREIQRKAWEADRRNTEQQAPVQQRQS